MKRERPRSPTPTDRPLLRVHGLSVHDGGETPIAGIELEVDVGEVVALLSGDGNAGGAVLSALVGLRERSGQVFVADQEIAPQDPVAAARAGILLAPQGGRTFPGLTVADHLDLAGEGRGGATRSVLDPAGTIEALMQARGRQTAATLSGGERRLLALAMVARAAPRVVLLDEPTEGIARELLRDCTAAVRAFAANSAVVIVERDLDLARMFTRRILTFDAAGAIVPAPDAPGKQQRDGGVSL